MRQKLAFLQQRQITGLYRTNRKAVRSAIRSRVGQSSPSPKIANNRLPLAGCVAFMAIGMVLGAWLDESIPHATAEKLAPLEVKSLYLLEPYDGRGILHMAADVRRNRQCVTKIDRVIDRTVDGTNVWHDQIGMSVPVTSEFVEKRFDVHIPALPPGEYTYGNFINADCGGGDTLAIAVHGPTFTVP